MSDPQVSSMELSTGSCVPLSFDLESGTPVEIYLSGSNLDNLNNFQLDSGPGVQWYVSGVISSSSSAIITAYATGNPGAGYLDLIQGPNRIAGILIDDFWVPVMD